MFKKGPALFLLILCLRSGYAKEPSTSPSIVLTAQENGLEPQTDFACYGKIHGYIRLAQRASGTHVLASRWISPQGKVVADSRIPVDFRPARSTAYVWFGFPEGSPLGATPDPQLEQDRLTFNGLWHLNVTWDDSPLLNTKFNVRCP